MVRIGDWIERPKFGADGDVTDISLLRPYLESRSAEIERWNAEHQVDHECPVNLG